MAAINSVTDLTIEDGIAVLTLNSPPVNALSVAVRDGIYQGMGQALDDAAVQAVVLICAGLARLGLWQLDRLAERRARSAELAAAAPAGAVVVHDIPLLVENGLQGGFDVVVVVDADDATRLARLTDVRGMSAQDARARMAAQATREQRREVADEVVVNDGTLVDLAEEVDRLWARLLSVPRRTVDR